MKALSQNYLNKQFHKLFMKKNQYIKGYEMNKFHTEILEIYHSLKIPNHFNKTGNRQYTNFQRFATILLFLRSDKSLRQFCQEFDETQWSHKLQLKYKLTKSTLNNWLKYFNLDLIKKMLNQTIKKEKPKICAIDGTGIDTDFKSKYYEKKLKKFGKKVKSNFHKLDIIVDVFGGKILNYSYLLKQRNDTFE